MATRATLKEQVAKATQARVEARQVELRARELAEAALAKEDRLRKQLELVEKRSQVAFEEELAEVDELDPPIPIDFLVEDFPWDDRLAMSPTAWANFSGDHLDLLAGTPEASSSNS